MIVLPSIRSSNQGRAMLLGYLAFCALYLGSAATNLAPARLLAPSEFDQAIPLLDWTVWVYLTQFLLLPTAIVCARDDATRSQTFYAMLVATALAAIVFLGWPTQIDRAMQAPGRLTGFAWSLLYAADTPRNCFPSLHVTLATLAGSALWRSGYRVTGLLWPAAIALSTLTTKQHVAWDVAGGLLLAPLAWIVTTRCIRYERTDSTRHAAGA